MTIRYLSTSEIEDENSEHRRALSTDSPDKEELTDALACPSGSRVIQAVTACVKAVFFRPHDTAVEFHDSLRRVIPKASIHLVSRCSLWTNRILILSPARSIVQSRRTVLFKNEWAAILRTLFSFRRRLCYFRTL